MLLPVTTLIELALLIVDPVTVEKNKFDATKLFPTYMSWLTLIIGVEILIMLVALISNELLLMRATLMVLPDSVENPIVFAVNPPVVALNVLIVDPVAVEKYRLDATRLFAT